MFVRQKKNKTGTVSVQVIDKSSGKYKVAQTIGSSREQNEIILFIEQAKSYIKKIRRQGEIDFLLGDDDHYYQSVYDQTLKVQKFLSNVFNLQGQGDWD